MAKKQKTVYQDSYKTNEIIDILKNFRLALKSLRFYPPNHSITKNSISELQTALTNYLIKNQKLNLIIKKNKLILNDKSNSLLDFSDLSSYLHNLKIRQISILSGVSNNELMGLLAILCMDRKDIFANGGLTEMMLQKNISHINIVELALNIVDVKDDQVKILSVSAAKKRAELVKIFNSKNPVSFEDSRLILIRLEKDSIEIAKLLIDIVVSNKSDQAGESKRLYQTLKKMDSIITQELPDEQSYLYQNLWEALQKLPENISDQLFSLILCQNDGSLEISKQLLSRLSADKLAEIITKSINDNNSGSATFNNLMDKLPVNRQKFNEIYIALKNKLPENFLEGAKLNKIDDTKDGFYQTLNKEISDKQMLEIAEFCHGKSSEAETIDQLSAYRRCDPRDEIVAILLDGLTYESDLDRFKMILDKLRSNISGFIRVKNYQPATKILHLIRETADDIEDITFKLEIKKTVNKICRRELFSLFIDACVQDDSALNDKDFLRLLREIGALATDTLLDMLAVEEHAKRRLAICQLISNINAGNVSHLGHKLHDQRWYLSRNIVNILGRIKNEEALEYIETAMAHPEKRVRLEAISALVNIGGGSSANLLVKLLKDKDSQVLQNAIAGLGAIGDKQSLRALIPLLKKRDIFFSRASINLEIIKSLGENGIDEAIPVLTGLKNNRSWLFKTKNKQLNLAAAKALVNIKKYQLPNKINEALL